MGERPFAAAQAPVGTGGPGRRGVSVVLVWVERWGLLHNRGVWVEAVRVWVDDRGGSAAVFGVRRIVPWWRE